MIATNNIRFGHSGEVNRNDLLELLIAGDGHWNPHISSHFQFGRQLAARAVSENAPNSLVVTSLLFKSCQFVASGTISDEGWTGDSLHDPHRTLYVLQQSIPYQCHDDCTLGRQPQRYIYRYA